MEQKFIHDIVAEANLLSLFFMQIFKNMLCKETQWSCEIQNFSLIVKVNIDYVNQYFLKKHLHALTKMTNVLRKLEPNII